jgi:hypothetical protein
VTNIKQLKNQENELLVFPNPANDMLHIKLPNENNFRLESINIYSIDGRKMALKSMIIDSANKSITVDINDLATGLYHLTIATKENNFNKQFVKQ